MVVVIGATGRMGSEVVKALIAKGQKVRALVRDPQRARAIQVPGVELVVGDVEKPDTWDAALQDVDKVFLLSPEGPQMAELHGKFADAAKRAGVRHLVRMSILVSNPDSPLVIGKWHGEADQNVANSGIPYTIIRPTYLMQNLIGSARMIASDGAFSGAMGDGKVGVIDTRDVGNVAATVLTSDDHEGKTYPLTGPEALSMGELAGKLSAVLGKEVKYVNVSQEDAKADMMAMGMPDWVADGWVAIAMMISTGAANIVTPMVKEVIGEEPRSFDQFARDHADAFRVG
ncbi:MAG: SDR family oxidoreductase [Actinobacteria bacterium]|nr:SDR family oxidoreductase [Actinomycetota bacterium]